MAIFNFNMPKPKPFHYSPRFYDERKERLEKIKARVEAELAAEKNGTTGYIGLQKGFLTEQRANSKLRRLNFEKKSSLRFLIILLAIVGLLYFVMPELFMVFWKGK